MFTDWLRSTFTARSVRRRLSASADRYALPITSLRRSCGREHGFSLQAAEDAIETRLVVVVHLKAELHAHCSLFKSAATNGVNNSFRVKRLSFSLTICGIFGWKLEGRQKKSWRYEFEG
jgi:hypothetical protein